MYILDALHPDTKVIVLITQIFFLGKDIAKTLGQTVPLTTRKASQKHQYALKYQQSNKYKLITNAMIPKPRVVPQNLYTSIFQTSKILYLLCKYFNWRSNLI